MQVRDSGRFIDYSQVVLARCTHPDLPDTNHQAIAHFVSHGFAGSIFGMLARVASKHSGCANPRLMVSGQSR
jgi:hypothetical protein